MALYQNKLKTRLILTNQLSVNPAGTKSPGGLDADVIDLTPEQLQEHGVKLALTMTPPALVPYQTPTAAQVKETLSASSKPVETKPVETKPVETTPAPEAPVAETPAPEAPAPSPSYSKKNK